MPLTKEERNEVYKEILEVYNSGRSKYLCSCARLVLKTMTKSGLPLPYTAQFQGWGLVKMYLPELWNHMPKDVQSASGPWWSSQDREIRLEVLDSCIKATE